MKTRNRNMSVAIQQGQKGQHSVTTTSTLRQIDAQFLTSITLVLLSHMMNAFRGQQVKLRTYISICNVSHAHYDK